MRGRNVAAIVKMNWRVLLSVLAMGSLLAILGGASALAQEATDVRGQVVNGTEGAIIPEDLSVLMLITLSLIHI